MGRHRLMIIGAVLLMAAVGMASMARRSYDSTVLIPAMEPGQFYAVDVRGESAHFPLEFSSGERYLLIAGCLGNSSRHHTVTIQAKSTDANHEVVQLRGHVVDLPEPERHGNRQLRQIDNRQYAPCSLETGNRSEDLSSIVPREFWLHVTDGPLNDAKHYARIEAVPMDEGNRVRVYRDIQQGAGELAPDIANNIVELLECDVMPEIEGKLGCVLDVDGDGKLTVLISPWLGRLQGGSTSLGGFVRGNDFRPGINRPFSNACDMIYLNSDLQQGQHLRDLLAHEFTHAVCFSNRIGSRNATQKPDEEDWLNEAIAHLSENGSSNVDYRISRFLNEPQRYPLVVSDYYTAGLWRSHGCRGATYLFLSWCAEQFGDEFTAALVHNPVAGCRNVEWASGRPFATLFRQWCVHLWTSDMDSVESEPHSAVATKIGSATAFQHSQSLRGQLGNWGIAGPRSIHCHVGDGEKTIEVAGTSAAFVELEGEPTLGTQSITVTGSWNSQLQVTLMKVPRDWPRVRLEFLNPSSGDSPTRELVVRCDDDVQVELLACECHNGDERSSVCWSDEKLATRQVATNDTLPTDIVGRFELPLSNRKGQPWQLVKVVACNQQGRRATAWLDFESRPELTDRWDESSSQYDH